MSEMMLAPGQFVELRSSLWQFVRKTNDGLYEFYNRALNKHEPFHKAQLSAWWESKELVILPMSDKPAKESVLRNRRIPFKHYSPEQQRKMKIREHYVKLFHIDFIAGKVTKDRNSVGPWLKGIAPPPEAKDRKEWLSRYQVPRAYDDWIAGGQVIEALAHGNAFGTHGSRLEPARDIIEQAIEQFHVPFPELEMVDLLKLIKNEINTAKLAGEIPAHDEDGNEVDYVPCPQTVYNWIDRLNGWEKRRIREGIEDANREHAPRGRKPKVALPFEEWQGDHALLPVETMIRLRDKNGNVVDVGMGAVWFTGFIDVASQYVYPPVLGTDGPSTARSLEAFRKAMCPKTDYFESAGLKDQFDPTTIPQMVFIDNQADNHGPDQDAAMADLDIESGYAGAYRGDHKESIERFNRKLKKFWRKFPGARPRGQKKRGKRPRQQPIIALTIETIRLETALFIAEYNDTPQKGLGGLAPRQVMEGGIAKIEASRKNGLPLPLRSIMTKTPDEIDRIFTIRTTATVRHNGVRYLYLEWSGSGFADREGHKVDIHIDPRNVQEIWCYDHIDKSWFKGFGVWPHYMQGLPWTEHLRIRARILKHEAELNKGKGIKRPSVDFKGRYMANNAEGLRRLFALAGKDFALDRTKKRNDRLWNGSRAIGHSVDFAILSTCATAVDFHEGRVAPGFERIMDLKKERGVMTPVSVEKPSKDAPAPYWETEDEDEIDMMSDPLARNEESAIV